MRDGQRLDSGAGLPTAARTACRYHGDLRESANAARVESLEGRASSPSALSSRGGQRLYLGAARPTPAHNSGYWRTRPRPTPLRPHDSLKRHDYSPERGTKSSLSNSAGGLKESHFRPERHDNSIVIIARRTAAKLAYCDLGTGNSHVGIAATWGGVLWYQPSYRGNIIRARRPAVALLLRTSSPRWAWTIDWVIARPRPTPPVSRFRDSSRR